MKKYENFVRSLKKLKDIYQYEPPYGNVEMTGMVGLFEVCFEQAWKAMKEILENNGFTEGKTGSPKMILKTAYQAGMIQNEEVWLEALISRNNVRHSYNEMIALDIIERTKKDYYDMFQELKSELEEKWLE